MSSAPLLQIAPTPAAKIAGPMATPGMAMLGMGGLGMFGQLISLSNAAGTEAQSLSSDQHSLVFGQAGLPTDPTMLLLPQEWANLSDEELKSLLVEMDNQSAQGLDANILTALTTGIPAKDALNYILSQGTPSEAIKTAQCMAPIDAEVMSQAETTTLSVSTDNINENPNIILLVGTGLTPSDIKGFKDSVKDALESIGTEAQSNAMQIDGNVIDDSTAQHEAMAASALILVLFVTPQPKASVAADAQILSSNEVVQTDILMLASPATLDSIDDNASFLAFMSKPYTSSAESVESIQNSVASENQNDIGSSFNLFDTEKPSPFSEVFGDLTPSGKTKAFTSHPEIKAEESGKQQNDVTSLKEAKAVVGEMTSQPNPSAGNLLSSFNSDTLSSSDSPFILANGNIVNSHNLSSLTNPVLTTASAASSHPTAQAVAIMVEKMASGSDKAKQELTVQLDPPELGRLQIQLTLEKDGPMKIHLLAEKQDTLALLQRDSHVLKAALDNAGINTDSSSLSFDLASGGQSFGQLMGGTSDQDARQSSRFTLNADGLAVDEGYMSPIESKMNFIPDQITGNIHYSLLV